MQCMLGNGNELILFNSSFQVFMLEQQLSKEVLKWSENSCGSQLKVESLSEGLFYFIYLFMFTVLKLNPVLFLFIQIQLWFWIKVLMKQLVK